MALSAEAASLEERLESRCSAAQRRFWVLDQLDPGNPSLNIAVQWRLEGDVTAATMERAFRLIIARHEVLRCYFEQIDGEPVQVVVPRVSFSIPVIDLSGTSEPQALVEADRIARAEARASFDLTVPPLIRVTLLRLRRDAAILLVTVHHTVCDGWSIGVIAREFGEICAAIDAGCFPVLPELPVSYGDYAAWLNERDLSTQWQQDLDYWSGTLKGMGYFELHTDRPRLPAPSINSEIRSVLLNRELTDNLAQVAGQHGCTLYMAVTAALFALLNRYTEETDIAIGTQVAGRDEVELESLVGVFINTVVLRADLGGDPTFAELMERMSALVSDVFEHQHLPIEKLIEILKPRRDLNRNPLFSVNFIYQRSFIETKAYGGFRLVDMPSCSAGALYDLNFFMVERPEGWRLSCEYKTDLFEAGTMDRCLVHFQNLLSAAVADPAQPVSALRILGDQERRRLLVEYNRTEAEFPSDATLPQLLAAQAARTPAAVALAFEDTSLTYAELDARSNRLAHHLRCLGVGPDAMVAICIERSIELVVGLVAILKAGGAYVPLDPAYPADRLRFMLEDCGARVLLTQRALRERLPAHDLQVVLLDQLNAEIEQRPDTVPASRVTADSLAYMIYTSGSTGRPKGAMNSHRAIVNRLVWMQAAYGLRADDRVLQKTPISFDVSVWELFWPLLYGARLVVARPGGHQDPAYLVDVIERYGITIAHFVPSMLTVFVQCADLQRCRSLRDVMCSGEALSVETQNAFLSGLPSRLHNLYGPTEAAVDVTAWQCQQLKGQTSVPIGRPISNIRLYILDRNQQPVPLGVPGELYIGGVGVARGYHNREELTRQRFIRSPFVAADRLYRTGDLVRYRSDGNIEFMGRLDHQIKLRGLRVELGEIESVLREISGIRDVAVLMREDSPGDQRLFAYIVADANAGTDSDLSAVLGRKLPNHMIPSAFVRLESLPLLPNGKLDRQSLPLPIPSARAPDRGGDTGRFDEVELRLLKLWREVLRCEDIGRTQNFFELGGHSLLAAHLLVKIEVEFKQRLTLAAMFKSPSIAEQANLIRRRGNRDFDFRQVVKLQPNGSRLPIVALNNTGIFYSLCKQLGPDQPFTCLQLFDPSAEDGKTLPDTIEEIAAAYVQLLRQIQPNGPYILAGWCIAGVLAFEVARQLEEGGAEIAMLVMMDTWAPGYLRRRSMLRAKLADYSYRLKLIAIDWSKVRNGQQSIGGFLANRPTVRRLMRLLGRPVVTQTLAGDFNSRLLNDENFDTWLLKHMESAARRYDARSLNRKIVLFRSLQEPRGLFLDMDMGWSELALRGVDTVLVQGDHYTMFQTPGVETLARNLSSRLVQVASAAG